MDSNPTNESMPADQQADDAAINDASMNSDAMSNDALLEQAENLIWTLLDDQIEPPQAKELEALLEQNEQVRSLYIQCVQMHCDLQQHFTPGEDQPQSDLPKSPVLGSLGDLRPGTDTLPLRD